jgi:hypothetical protein
MICPRPNTHDPNPAAVPIKEAIKETFRVFMPHPRLLDTTKTPVWFHPDSAILPPNRACSSNRLLKKRCYLNPEPILNRSHGVPLTCYRKHHAGVVRAANCGCSLESTSLIHDHTVGTASVFPAAEECIKHTLPPSARRSRRQFEDDTTAVPEAPVDNSAPLGCAVEIPGGVEDQLVVARIPSILSAGEGMEHD